MFDHHISDMTTKNEKEIFLFLLGSLFFAFCVCRKKFIKKIFSNQLLNSKIIRRKRFLFLCDANSMLVIKLENLFHKERKVGRQHISFCHSSPISNFQFFINILKGFPITCLTHARLTCIYIPYTAPQLIIRRQIKTYNSPKLNR